MRDIITLEQTPARQALLDALLEHLRDKQQPHHNHAVKLKKAEFTALKQLAEAAGVEVRNSRIVLVQGPYRFEAYRRHESRNAGIFVTRNASILEVLHTFGKGPKPDEFPAMIYSDTERPITPAEIPNIYQWLHDTHAETERMAQRGESLADVPVLYDVHHQALNAEYSSGYILLLRLAMRLVRGLVADQRPVARPVLANAMLYGSPVPAEDEKYRVAVLLDPDAPVGAEVLANILDMPQLDPENLVLRTDDPSLTERAGWVLVKRLASQLQRDQRPPATLPPGYSDAATVNELADLIDGNPDELLTALEQDYSRRAMQHPEMLKMPYLERGKVLLRTLEAARDLARHQFQSGQTSEHLVRTLEHVATHLAVLLANYQRELLNWQRLALTAGSLGHSIISRGEPFGNESVLVGMCLGLAVAHAPKGTEIINLTPQHFAAFKDQWPHRPQ